MGSRGSSSIAASGSTAEAIRLNVEEPKTLVKLSKDNFTDLVRSRHSGHSWSQDEFNQVESYIADMKSGTVLDVSLGRGVHWYYEKNKNGNWTRYGAYEPEQVSSKDIAYTMYGYKGSGSPQGISLNTIKARPFLTPTKTPSFLTSDETTTTRLGNSGTIWLDLGKSDVTKANISKLERAGWKRRGSRDDTWRNK